MTISVEEFNAHNRHELHRCNGMFVVDSMLVLHADQGVPSYSIVPVAPYTKQYPHSKIDLNSYLAQPDKGIFFAYCDGQLAGQIILSRNWNGYAYVDDISVDAAFRRHGIGSALIQQAVDRAKAKGLPGIMLETQNTNVAACLFYQRCGFELGGFDRSLYRGLEPNTEEIALFWYLFFRD